MASFPTSIPEHGRLQEITLPRILIELYRARSNGYLQLARNRVEKRIALRDGAPVASESNLPSESLGVQLMDWGRLSRNDYSTLNSYVERNQCQEGAALLSLKLLEPKELFTALKKQLRQRILDCFGWPEGSYQLGVEDDSSGDIEPFRTDPYRLVQDGLRTHWSPDRMLSGLADRMERFPHPTPALRGVVRRLELDEELQTLLAGLSGRQTLGRALAPFLRSPAALAAVWVLDAADALAYCDEADASAIDGEENPDVDLDIEIEIRRAESDGGGKAPSPLKSARPASSESAGGVRRPDAETDPPAVSSEAQNLREEILRSLEQLDSLDYYALLGVAPEAEAGAIRKAYFSAAKRYHPDALTRLGLDDIAEEAAKVFARIAEANEVLSDAKKRANYDASLESGEPEIDVDKLAQAETFYRKGEILMNMGDFKGALEYLRPAVDLWPNEAAYQSALAWAYYKKTPSEPEQASVHLRQALALDPDDAISRFRMGLVERTLEGS